MGNLVANVVTGRYMTLLERFNVPEWVEAVRRHRPSYVSGPPAVAQMVLDAGVDPEDLASVHYFYGGSAPISAELKARLLARYGITTLWAYGATEFCGTIISWTLALHQQYGEAKPDSMGRPLPGITVRVVDTETGAPLPIGAQGYLEARVPVLGDEWIRTTDLAMIDEDGFVYHRGRGDGAILRGGFKILPETVADALRLHPAVFDAAVVGLTDARLGQTPGAAVQLRNGVAAVSPEALERHLRAHLAAPYIPTVIRVVDALPRTPSLKVDQGAVRALLGDG